MEELQLLVDMVSKLPSMALWVIAFFFVYKVLILGSIVGVIKFTVGKLHDYLTTPKEKLVDIRPMLDGMTIGSELEPLLVQIRRLRGKGTTINSKYIHGISVKWLCEAIDDKEAKDITERQP